MALTPQIIQAMNAATGRNVPVSPSAPPSRANQVRALANTASNQTQPPTVQTSASDPLASVHIGGNANGDPVQEIGNQVKSGVAQIEKGTSSGSGNSLLKESEAGMGVAAGAASILTSPLAPLFKPVGAAVGGIGDKVSNLPQVQKFATSPAGADATRVAQDVSNTASVVGTVAGLGGGVDAAPSALDNMKSDLASAKNTIQDAKDSFTPESSAKSTDDNKILSAYNRAIKPTTAGKTGPGQFAAYNKDVVNAVKSISDNSGNLSFTDATGNTEVGRTPQSRGELADALTQTKASIFSKYDSLAKQAGDAGAGVNLKPVSDSLNDIINNEALKITNPGAVEYAKGIQDRLTNSDGTSKVVDAKTAQDVITNYNAALKAFYRSPTYDTASRASIDAGVVHQIRAGLDDAINNATGEDYQALKSQYGSLSSIEKDVNKAAIAQAKQVGSNASGLGKYVDVFAGGSMISSLLSLNPALFATGVAEAGINHFFQWYNAPDRAVGSMFDAAKSGK